MLLPIGHEKLSARRWPVVTTAFIVACIAAYPFVATRTDADATRIEAAAKTAVSYYHDHPYLTTGPALAPFRKHSALDLEALLAPQEEAAPPPKTPPDDVVREEQDELDALEAKVTKAVDDSLTHTLGYVPARHNVLGLVTYPFVHSGVLHLAFNLWFLWLCGCNLEDRWGRLAFPSFFVASGVVAALVHGLASRGVANAVPIVGASGAIAGAMGAFLVVHARAKIRFAYVLGFRPRTFEAPAFAMLPLWLLTQVLWGVLFPNDGVAYWAHVGGFLFGVAVAFALSKSGLDRRLDAAVERTVALDGDPRLDAARDLVARGRAEDALAMLEGLALEKPDVVDVQRAVLGAAQASRATASERTAFARLVQLHVMRGELAEASRVAAEMRAKRYEASLDAKTAKRLAEHEAMTAGQAAKR